MEEPVECARRPGHDALGQRGRGEGGQDGIAGDKVISLFKKEGLILPDGRLSVPMGLTGELTEPEVDDRITPILENAVLESLIPGL